MSTGPTFRFFFILFLLAISITVILIKDAEIKNNTHELVDPLVDFDLYYYNQNDSEINQLSLVALRTGEIIELNLTKSPFIKSGECGLFTAPIPNSMFERFIDGYKVIAAAKR